MPQQATMVLIFVVLSGLVLVAIISLVRGFIKGARLPREPGPYVPFVDTVPPEPVLRTRGLIAVAWATIGWAAVNLALAGLAWSVTGFTVRREVYTELVAAYVAAAAILAGVGGGMLLGRKAYGRRMVSWGHFLLGILAFIGAALALLLRGQPKIPGPVRGAVVYVVIALGVHLLITTVIGSLAQHAGKPAEGEAGAGEPATKD